MGSQLGPKSHHRSKTLAWVLPVHVPAEPFLGGNTDGSGASHSLLSLWGRGMGKQPHVGWNIPESCAQGRQPRVPNPQTTGSRQPPNAKFPENGEQATTELQSGEELRVKKHRAPNWGWKRTKLQTGGERRVEKHPAPNWGWKRTKPQTGRELRAEKHPAPNWE